MTFQNTSSMKHFITIIALLFISQGFSQVDDAALVKQTIETFFDGFHKQDSAIIKSVAREDMTLRSISADKEGNQMLSTATSLSSFMKSIVSIPKSASFEEKILDYQVAADGAMALAWTPYEFYFNGQFSHCGVNNFTLFKNNGNWEVIAIVDTRGREGCEIAD